MSKRRKQTDSPKNLTGLRRLLDDLSRVGTETLPISEADNDMLSIIVDEAIKGVEISKRYPDFYKKLLGNHELRKAFLDTMESIELEEINELVVMPGPSSPNLGFLTNKPAQPTLSKLDDKWQISWLRTIDQLRSIFSPVKLAYRSDPAMFEDPWFTLLRDEIEVNGIMYSVVLECTFSEDEETALSPFLNIAVTVGATKGRPHFPVQTSLQWGAYDESLQIHKEGRAKFPDIPFKAVFDKEKENIKAELNLTIRPPL